MQQPRHHRSLCLLFAAALFSLAAFSTALGGTTSRDERETNLQTFDQVWTTVRDKHFDPELGGVDWDAAREELRPEAERATSKSALRGVLTSLLRRLGQSHLAIIPGEAMPAREEPGELVPPGEQVWDSGSGFAVALVDGEARVASVQASSAVGRAGVQEGWRIARVGSTAVPRTCETTGAVNFPLATASGDSVAVEFVDPDGEALEVDIPLGNRRGREYQFEGLPPMPVSIEHRFVEPDIGYITFSMFFDPVMVMSHFARAMAEFRDTTGVIIDVRGNGGGMGAMATAMISWFVDEETSIGTMVARASELEAIVSPRAETYGGKVAVLIDRGSGSSAELFAAGMRDAAGARLFGSSTAGAVLPSAFDRLPNGDYLQYVIANYVTVNGKELEGPGVAPDQETDPRRSADPLEDESLMYAVDWILGHE